MEVRYAASPGGRDLHLGDDRQSICQSDEEVVEKRVATSSDLLAVRPRLPSHVSYDSLHGSEDGRGAHFSYSHHSSYRPLVENITDLSLTGLADFASRPGQLGNGPGGLCQGVSMVSIQDMGCDYCRPAVSNLGLVLLAHFRHGNLDDKRVGVVKVAD